MHLTLRGYYALLALSTLTRLQTEGTWIRLEEISRGKQIPENFLLQIFQVLKRGGLIQSKRGANGGYALAKPAETITLAGILECVEGTLFSGPFDGTGTHSPGQMEEMDQSWEEVRGRLNGVLDGYTLRDLSDRCFKQVGDMYYI